MRTKVIAALALVGALWGGSAEATQGYVVEAHGASLDVGASVESATSLDIEPGGHVVIMTSTARMIRRDGPYRGLGADLLEASAGAAPAREALGANLMLGLVALAKQADRSEETSFGVRGTGAEASEAEAGPYAIGPGVNVFCIHDDVRPAFFTPDPPETSSTLVMRRVTRPKELLRTAWPAASRRIEWPSEWPLPEKGRYLVAIGQGGGWAVRMIPVGPRPPEALQQAALYYEAGCSRQASAALRLAVNGAEQH